MSQGSFWPLEIANDRGRLPLTSSNPAGSRERRTEKVENDRKTVGMTDKESEYGDDQSQDQQEAR